MPILSSTVIVVLVAVVLIVALIAIALMTAKAAAHATLPTYPAPTKSERAVRMQIECLAEGHHSQSYRPVGGGMAGYGELWGRTKSGEIGWIYLFQDTFFSDLESLVGELAISKEDLSAACLDILGELADPSPSGRPYDFNHRVYCPVCGSPEVQTLSDSDSVIETIVLPVATHHHWDKQTETRQRQLVKEALGRHGWPAEPAVAA